MLPVFDETQCSQDPIRGWTLGILGYGNQGRAHALNLRDSGHHVVVIVDADRASASRAVLDGFTLVDPARAVFAADLIAMLTPDEEHRRLVEQVGSQVPPGTPEGHETAAATPHLRLQAWVFAHGFALVFDEPRWSPPVDVFVVAPAGPGLQLRSRYETGRGIPALLAIHRDESGHAAERARAYAAALGCARAGVLETTVRDEVEVDLFGEQAVLCGGMNALTQAAFDTLVEAGYPEEMAYLECVQQLRLTAELVERYGIAGMRERISGTARFGDLTRGPRVVGAASRAAMGEILAEVRDGSFAREWLAQRSRPNGSLGPRDAALPAPAAPAGGVERAGERIRSLFDSADEPS